VILGRETIHADWDKNGVWTVENACKLMRADLLVRLVDEDGLRAIDIARATGLRQAGQLHVHPVSNPRR